MKTSRNPKLYEYKPGTIELLKCLYFESQWLPLLSGRHKPYEKFLNGLEQHFIQMHMDPSSVFSVSGISKALEINYTQLVKWLNQIYNDIFELNCNEPELFKSEGIRYDLNFNCLNSYASFTLWFKAPLQPDESFSWYFMIGKMRLNFFHVEKITHDYYHGEHMVSAILGTNFPNVYRKFILEKAYFYRKIGLSESFINQIDLGERLKRHYPQ